MSDVDRGGGKGGCVGTRIQAEARAKAGSESFLTGRVMVPKVLNTVRRAIEATAQPKEQLEAHLFHRK